MNNHYQNKLAHPILIGDDKVLHSNTVAKKTSKFSLPALMITLFYLRPWEKVPALIVLHLSAVFSLGCLTWILLSGKVNRRQIFALKPVRWILVLFLMAIISVPFSFYKRGSLEAIENLIVPLALFLSIVTFIRSWPSFIQLLWVLVLCMDYHAYHAVRAFFTVSYQGARVLGDVGGIFRGSNELASFFVMTIPFVWFLFRNSTKKISKIVSLVSLLLMIAGNIAMQSRGGLLGLLSLGVISVILAKNRFTISLFVAAFTLSLIFLMPSKMLQRYSKISFSIENLDPSAASRIYAWKKGLEMFTDHPITGVGISQFGVAFGTQYRDDEWQDKFASQFGEHAWLRPHNTFVQVLAEIGVLGLVAFIMAIVTSCYYMWGLIKLESKAFGFYAKCCLCATISYFVCLMFDHQAFSVPTFTLFGLLTLPQTLGASEQCKAEV